MIKYLICCLRGHKLTEDSEGWYILPGCGFMPLLCRQKTCKCGKHRAKDDK